ncbi:MAG: hypothetical protein AAF608_05165 [Pseudomonadota bacterium]
MINHFTLPLVIIESPFGGDINRNIAYAQAAVNDSLRRGEAPFASHLFYTRQGILDDTGFDQRELGLKSGFAWGEKADLVAVYQDLGISRGMEQGIDRAVRASQEIVFRNIPGWNALV